MIILHDIYENNYKTNGLGLLDRYIIDPIVYWKLNGEYSFEFKYPLYSPLGFDIKEYMQVEVVNTDYSDVFRIKKVKKNMGMLEIYCEHKSYDLNDNYLYNINPGNITTHEFLNEIEIGLAYQHPFRLDTSMEGKRLIEDLTGINGMQALLGDNSYISNFGGEIYRNYNVIEFHNTIGQDRGITIEYRKDLIAYNEELDTREVITRLVPYAKNGYMLPERYVDSPLVDKEHPIIGKIEYSDIVPRIGDDIDNEEAIREDLAQEEMRKRAKKEFSDNNIDKPNVTYDIDFVALSKTEEYKGYEVLQTIKRGDTVHVYHPKDNLDIKARVIELSYNPLAEVYIDVKLGKHSDRIVGDNSVSNKIISEINKNINNALKTYVSPSPDGKNRIFYGIEEPTGKLKDDDLWYKSVGEGATELYIYKDGSWSTEPILTTTGVNDLKLQIENELQIINGKLTGAEETVDNIKTELDTAVSNAGFTTLDELIKAQKETISDNNNQISFIEQNVKGFQSTVLNQLGISNVTQLATGIQSIVKSYAGIGNVIYGTLTEPTKDIYYYSSYAVNIPGNVVNQYIDKEKITIAFDIKGSGYFTVSTTFKTSSGTVVSTKKYVSSSTERFTYDFVVSSNQKINRVEFKPSAGSIQISKFIVGLGGMNEVNTDWTTNYGVSESYFNQTKDLINLGVKKDDLLSEINIQAGHMIFRVNSDNKLYINDDGVYMANGFIKDAHISNLSASKITTGDLDASKVRVINLSANSITAGKIQGPYFYLDTGLGRYSTWSDEYSLNMYRGKIEYEGARGLVGRRDSMKGTEFEPNSSGAQSYMGMTKYTLNGKTLDTLTLTHGSGQTASINYYRNIDTTGTDPYIVFDRFNKFGLEAPIRVYEDIYSGSKITATELLTKGLRFVDNKLYINGDTSRYLDFSTGTTPSGDIYIRIRYYNANKLRSGIAFGLSKAYATNSSDSWTRLN